MFRAEHLSHLTLIMDIWFSFPLKPHTGGVFYPLRLLSIIIMSKITLLSISQDLGEHIATMPLVWPHSEASAMQIAPARPQLRKHVMQHLAALLNILVCAHVLEINKQRCVVIFRTTGQAALAAFRPVLAANPCGSGRSWNELTFAAKWKLFTDWDASRAT